MNNSKLLELLRSFNHKERKSFAHYLNSGNENQNFLPGKLYYYLLKFQPLFQDEKLKKRIAYPFIFGKKSTFDDLKMRHLMAELLKLLEFYLSLNNSDFINELNLLDFYRTRKLEKHFNSSLRKLQTLQQQETTKDSKYYYSQFQLELEVHHFLTEKFQRTGKDNLQKVNENLDTFYIIHKLKNCCEILNYQKIMSGDYKLLLMDEIIEHVQSNNYEHVPAIAIYYNILMTLKDPSNESFFFKLKELLYAEQHFFSREECWEMFTYAQNYCIQKINTGIVKYLKELFSLYQFVLKNEIILQEDALSPWHYKNIVVIALRLEEFTWTENFIHRYKDKIPAQYRDNAFTYNLAKYYFYKKEYKNVLKLLQKVDYEDIFYNLDSRTMLVKIYFELKEMNSLYSTCDSFKMYLRRSKLISHQHKINYRNFIRFTEKLTRLDPEDKEKAEQIKNELSNLSQVADINWLVKQTKS